MELVPRGPNLIMKGQSGSVWARDIFGLIQFCQSFTARLQECGFSAWLEIWVRLILFSFSVHIFVFAEFTVIFVTISCSASSEPFSLGLTHNLCAVQCSEHFPLHSLKAMQLTLKVQPLRLQAAASAATPAPDSYGVRASIPPSPDLCPRLYPFVQELYWGNFRRRWFCEVAASRIWDHLYIAS